MAQEAKLQTRIINDLKKRWYIPVKLIRTNTSGIADILVLTGNGSHFWIEVKAENGKESELQKYIRNKLTLFWDTAHVVYNWDEYLSIYD